jgi:nucleotide-binding universal stress UspA family protein
MPTEPDGLVVVGVDGFVASLAAVDLAAEEAVARAAPLLIVMAGNAEPKAAAFLDAAAVRVLSEHPGLPVDTVLVPGDPAIVLLDLAHDASLLVIGEHGHQSKRQGHVGPVASDVVRHADVPVIVHRPVTLATDIVTPRPVLAGVAANGDTDPVLRFAFTEAALRGAAVSVLHIENETRGETPDGVLADALNAWADKYPDTPVFRTIRHDVDAAVALTAASRAAQLAVIGSPRTDDLPASSVCHALLDRGWCPIAIVPRQM